MCFLSACAVGQLYNARQALDPNSAWDISGKKGSCCASCAAHRWHTMACQEDKLRLRDLPGSALVFTKTRAQPAFMEPLKEELGSLQRARIVIAVRLPKPSVASACDNCR